MYLHALCDTCLLKSFLMYCVPARNKTINLLQSNRDIKASRMTNNPP